MAADGAQSIEGRRRDLEEQMRYALSKLREFPYFRLEDYMLPAAPPDALPLAESMTKVRRRKAEPLYLTRPLAPRLSSTTAKPIQTYNHVVG